VYASISIFLFYAIMTTIVIISLVHSKQGDVSGGHYYAFIRPSLPPSAGGAGVEFWNGSIGQNLNGCGGQWFKFDDDCVTKVEEFVAVEGCFGGNESRSSISSAYMLVYVREDRAGEVSTLS